MTLQTDQPLGDGPLVSVVMPVYNASAFVKESVASVFAQTVSDFELIVINDGSTDSEQLEKVLAPYLDRIHYIKQENGGVSSARNAGLRIAKGKFYAQIDADDVWKPDYLESQLEFLKNNPSIGLVYPNAEVFTEGSNTHLDFNVLCPSEGEPTFENLIRQKCLVMTSVTARMEAIRRVGFFDESLATCEDFDFWLRFAKVGGRLGYHTRPLLKYRRRAGSLSSDSARMLTNLLRVLNKAATFELTPAEKIAIADELERRQAALNVIEGKKALVHKDTDNATRLLSLANSHLRSRKLTLVLWALRLSPHAVSWAFNLRRRLFLRTEKSVLAGYN